MVRSAQAGEVAPTDKTYLAQIVTARAGIPQTDAEKRVNEAFYALKTGVERARKIAVVLGFLTASILLIGAAVAWWAAAIGGTHRDAGIIWLGLAKVERVW